MWIWQSSHSLTGCHWQRYRLSQPDTDLPLMADKKKLVPQGFRGELLLVPTLRPFLAGCKNTVLAVQGWCRLFSMFFPWIGSSKSKYGCPDGCVWRLCTSPNCNLNKDNEDWPKDLCFMQWCPANIVLPTLHALAAPGYSCISGFHFPTPLSDSPSPSCIELWLLRFLHYSVPSVPAFPTNMSVMSGPFISA